MKFGGNAFRQVLEARRGDSALPGMGSAATGDVLPLFGHAVGYELGSRKDAVFFL